jgi:uncharacterized membrane protein
MSRTTIITELTVFLTLVLGILFFSAHIWDETPRGVIVLLVFISLVLGYHTSEFLNRFNSEE